MEKTRLVRAAAGLSATGCSLAPERVHDENGRTRVGFGWTMSGNAGATCRGGAGTFEPDADGVVRMASGEEHVPEICRG